VGISEGRVGDFDSISQEKSHLTLRISKQSFAHILTYLSTHSLEEKALAHLNLPFAKQV
jgi:hypothetical protein